MLNLTDREWKEFFIGGEGGIFSIKHGKRLTVAEMTKGTIPFIGATETNNGITNWVGVMNCSYDKNVLGVNYNGSVAEAFYHGYGCVFSDDVKRLHLKEVEDNKYILLFIATVIKLQKVKYTYGYKFSGNRMNRQIILLPVDEAGKPDYAFMEQFIKEREDLKRKQYITYAQRKIQYIEDGGGGY